MRHEFFMRFYGPMASANATACEDEMRGRFPQITGTAKGPLSTSVNTHYAATDVEMTLRFASNADMEAVRADEAGKAIYMRFCTKGVQYMAQPGTFAMRRPGDKGGMASLMTGVTAPSPAASPVIRVGRAMPAPGAGIHASAPAPIDAARFPNKDSGIAVIRIAQPRSGAEVLEELRSQRPRQRG